MSNTGMQVSSSILTRRSDNKWILNHPFAQSGGALFVIKAKWCGYCHKLDAEIKKAFSYKAFKYFYLDEEGNQKLLQQMNVSGFPTLFYVNQGGVLSDYKGDRTAIELSKNFK
jgi:thiol-disulfide isomerase/thioredoxin